jgi:hypothetical protein
MARTPDRGIASRSRYRQAEWPHSHRSSVCWPFSLQCSLQYFPCSPPFGTMQLQAGCAHFSAFGTIPPPGESLAEHVDHGRSSTVRPLSHLRFSCARAAARCAIRNSACAYASIWVIAMPKGHHAERVARIRRFCAASDRLHIETAKLVAHLTNEPRQFSSHFFRFRLSAFPSRARH